MNNSYHEAIKTKPYKALFGDNPRCGLAKKLPEHFFLQIGCSDMREEVLESMLQEETSEESESLADTPLPDEEEPFQQCEDVDWIDEVPSDDYVQMVEEQEVSSESRKRIGSSSEDVAEYEHPAKRVRLQAKIGIDKQAARMVARSSRKMKPLSPGDNVAVPISKFDRSNGDPPNVIGVILSIDEKGLFTIGTKSGKIRGKLSRSQIEPVNYKGLKDEDVPSNIELSVREIVCDQSVCNGQGFTKCNCKGNCLKSCSCFKKGLHCNSACHSKKVNQNCKNVES